MSKAVINANRSKGVINRNIYGQFAEHLGRCIYKIGRASCRERV